MNVVTYSPGQAPGISKITSTSKMPRPMASCGAQGTGRGRPIRESGTAQGRRMAGRLLKLQLRAIVQPVPTSRRPDITICSICANRTGNVLTQRKVFQEVGRLNGAGFRRSVLGGFQCHCQVSEEKAKTVDRQDSLTGTIAALCRGIIHIGVPSRRRRQQRGHASGAIARGHREL